MALPKLNTAQYELKVPSTGKTIEYRPFLVKEEKILLMALEGEEEKEMAKAIKQILSQCVLTENFKIDNLALVDVEYIFLKVRGKAVGDKSKIYIVCTNTECENKIEIELDLEAIKIDTHKDHTDLIKLTDDIQVRMVPPKMEYLMATVSKNQIDLVMDVIRDSISEIIQGKEVFSAQDHTKEELEEFLNSLNSGQFQNVRQFFETMPALRHDIEYTCNKCNKTEKQTLQGLASFFASA